MDRRPAIGRRSVQGQAASGGRIPPCSSVPVRFDWESKRADAQAFRRYVSIRGGYLLEEDSPIVRLVPALIAVTVVSFTLWGGDSSRDRAEVAVWRRCDL